MKGLPTSAVPQSHEYRARRQERSIRPRAPICVLALCRYPVNASSGRQPGVGSDVVGEV